MKLTPHLILRISLWIKAVDAVFEIVAGILLLMPVRLFYWIQAICEHEINMGKHEAAFLRIQDMLASSSLLSVTVGIAIYLMAHGALKLTFITAVMKERIWGYLGLMVFLAIFGLIELAHFAEHRAYVVLVFAIFDGLIVYLSAKEYNAHRRSAASEAA